MTDEEFRFTAKRLTENQQKYIETIYLMSELVDAVNRRIGDFTRTLGNWRDLFGSTRDLMEEHVAMSRELCELQKQVIKAYADNSLAITENNERLDKLMTKMEKHFGSDAGLEYEN
jgi:Mg2+ and Co2+ transporter CorA